MESCKNCETPVREEVRKELDKAIAYMDEGKFHEAFVIFQLLAEQGLADAQFNLGDCYKDGEGIKEDPTKAVEWYRKAAEQGLADAQFNLGIFYEYGEGVEKDLVKAFEWYRKAAEQGDIVAQVSLGGCYLRGEGVERDHVEAFEWYRKATDQTHDSTQDALIHQE